MGQLLSQPKRYVNDRGINYIPTAAYKFSLQIAFCTARFCFFATMKVQVQVLWIVKPYSDVMEVTWPSETLVFYQTTTRRHKPESQDMNVAKLEKIVHLTFSCIF